MVDEKIHNASTLITFSSPQNFKNWKREAQRFCYGSFVDFLSKIDSAINTKLVVYMYYVNQIVYWLRNIWSMLLLNA